jgi:hypothetical protein
MDSFAMIVHSNSANTPGIWNIATPSPLHPRPATTLASKGRANVSGDSAAVLYALAKLLEFPDQKIYSLGSIVSGHTLKHLAAAPPALQS